MRSYDVMMKLILEMAEKDERIRAVTMEGSSVLRPHDEFSDFDITYFVSDIRKFTKSKSWLDYFGELLIMQCPDDSFDSPYNYDEKHKFTYLMQFKDGNRIDLTLIDISEIAFQERNTEPRTVLLNKDGYKELTCLKSEEAFYIKKPCEKEFFDTVNEFRWVSLYITKGLLRDQLYYAKYHYDVVVMEMFIKMLNWKIGARYGFDSIVGKCGAYFKNFLSKDEMERFENIFPCAEYEDIWQKLFNLTDFFEESAKETAERLNFPYDKDEAENIKEFIKSRYKKSLQ